MATRYPFERTTEDSLIEVIADIDRTTALFVLDTGASHTIVDLGILIKEGYRMGDTKGLVFIETANGLIQAHKFTVSKLLCLGIEKENMEVSTFLFDDPQENVKGVIGLDFLDGLEVCINLKEYVITVR